MVIENMYDNYRQTLVRIMGTSDDKKIDVLIKEIFSLKNPNTKQNMFVI